MRGALVTLKALMVKELTQTSRDKRVMAILIIAPVIQLIVLGFAVNLEVDDVRLVIADQDASAASRALVSDLLAGETFTDAGRVATGEEGIEALVGGQATAVLVIPPGLEEDLAAGRSTTLQALVDGTDSNRGTISGTTLEAYGVQRGLTLSSERLGIVAASLGQDLNVPRVRIEPRIFYNPTLDSQTYFVPGVAATLLLVVGLIVTSMGLAREKEMGTLEQVMVTPIAPSTLIAGKTIPYAFIGLVDLGLVLAAGVLIFDVPLRGSLLVIFVGGALYLLAIMGVGLLISVAARTQQQAFMGAIFFTLPAILLGGFLTPVENMPEALRWVSAVDPVRHMVEILRAVMLKSASWADVAAPLTALAGIGLTVFGAAVVALRSRLS